MQTQHMFGTVVPQIIGVEAPQERTVVIEESGTSDFGTRGPTGRPVGGDAARLACTSDRQAEGYGNRRKAPGGRDHRAFDEDQRRISIIDEPPPEEGRRQMDRLAGDQKPGRSERLLKPKPPGRPLGSAPHSGESCGADQKDLTPEDFCSRQIRPRSIEWG